MKKVEIKLSEGDVIWDTISKRKGVFHKDIDGAPFISYSRRALSYNIDFSNIEKYECQDNFEMFLTKSRVLHSLNRIAMTTGNVKGDRFEGINLFTGEKTYFLLDPKWVDITNDYHMTLSKYL